MRAIMLLLCLGCTGTLFAQPIQQDAVRKELVRIYSAGTSGSGFICGSTSDSVFIVTARHVVEHDSTGNGTLVILADSGEKIKAKILFRSTEEELDLALLGIRKRRVGTSGPETSGAVDLVSNYFYFPFPKEGEAPRTKSEGELISWSLTKKRYFFDIEDVHGGDSGSAVFKSGLSSYLIGMIIGSGKKVAVLPIEFIKETIQSNAPGKWKLNAR